MARTDVLEKRLQLLEGLLARLLEIEIDIGALPPTEGAEQLLNLNRTSIAILQQNRFRVRAEIRRLQDC